MERASRIVSILLGLGVTVLLWPVAVPLGFGEVWWASQKAQWQSDAKPLPRRPIAAGRPVSRASAASRELPCPRPRRPVAARRLPTPHAVETRTPRRQSRLNRRRPTPDRGKLPRRCEGPDKTGAVAPANHDRSSITASPCATAARCNRAVSSSSLPASPPAMTRPPAKGPTARLALRRCRQSGPGAADPRARRHLRGAEAKRGEGRRCPLLGGGDGSLHLDGAAGLGRAERHERARACPSGGCRQIGQARALARRGVSGAVAR